MGFFDTEKFDASKVAPNTTFTPLPEGTYKVVIKAAQEKPTKDGKGSFVELVLSVLSPETGKGRQLWHRITLRHQDRDTQDRGRADLSTLCRAVGVLTPKSFAQFVGKLLTVKVIIEKRKDNGELSNKVKQIALPEKPAADAAPPPAPAPTKESAPEGDPPADPPVDSSPW